MAKEYPIPTPSWEDKKASETDELAKKEFSTWPSEFDIKGTKDKGTLDLLRHSGILTVAVLWFVAVAATASMIIWLLHFLTPWGWLTDYQLSKVQTVLFSSGLGALVSAFVHKKSP